MQYISNCKEQGSTSICGSAKTLNFMEWLGIHVPDNIKKDLISSASPVMRSVELATDIAKDLIHYCKQRSIPFGFNIESVAIRKDEIEASIYMVNKIAEMLDKKGIRKMKVVS